jgi:tetratricopeptide (TPR) repeat protein
VVDSKLIDIIWAMGSNSASNKTIGLAMIMKDETNDLQRIIREYGEYFDRIYVTVTHKPTYDVLLSELKELNYPKFELSYFEWINHYGKARLYNLSKVKTDYWMWIDLDDSIINPDKIPELFSQAIKEDLDIVYLPYDYYQNEFGDSESMLWRERIIKNSPDIKWESVTTHETVLAPDDVSIKQISEVVVKHNKSLEDKFVSIFKSHAELEKQWKKQKGPQLAMYLAASYAAQENIGKSLKLYRYVTRYGSTELEARAYTQIASTYYVIKDYQESLKAANQAIKIEPDLPDPWFEKVLSYMALFEYDKAAKAADTALSKKPDYSSMYAVDPTKYTYKGFFLAAKAHLYNLDTSEAYRLFKRAQELSPDYIAKQSSSTVNWSEIFEEAKDNPDLIKQMLPLPIKKWAGKTIAYYVGRAEFNWGPDTLDKGIGGSEEAVIYLSRELAKLGYKITVFCQRKDSYIDRISSSHKVTYKPWYEFNPNDTFDTFIASRLAVNVYGIKARQKLLDLHDAVLESNLIGIKDHVTKFMVKSRWQRNLYPNIADDKFVVISNGILKDQFA